LCQLTAAEVATTLIAYEPVWAIGSGGRPATSSELGPVLAALRGALDELSDGAGTRALLYGGSVHRGNAADLLADPHIDGLFVGRAAWDVCGYLELLAIGRAQLDSPAWPARMRDHTSPM